VEIQLYVMGVRNMVRGKVTKPMVTIHFPNGVNLATNPSNVPSPNNPNFCQFFAVKHDLPIQTIFSPAIRVAVQDNVSIGAATISRVFRRNKKGKQEHQLKTLGFAFIELHDFLGDADGGTSDGWTHPSEFKKLKKMREQKAFLERMAKVDAAKEEYEREKEERRIWRRQQLTMQRMEAVNNYQPDYNANREFYDSEAEDDAANLEIFKSWLPVLFGQDEANRNAYFSDDLHDEWSEEYDHEAFERKVAEHDEVEQDKQLSWGDLVGLHRVPALKTKAYYKEPMEDKIKMNPFITSEIKSGQNQSGDGQDAQNPQNHRSHKIGELKCLIRIKEDLDAEKAKEDDTKKKGDDKGDADEKAKGGETKKGGEKGDGKRAMAEREREEAEALSHLTVGSEVMCRVYVLRALDLIPPNDDGESTCDPYFKISLNGKGMIDTKDHHLSDSRHPEFYDVHQVPVKLPGDTTIGIALFDHNGQLTDDSFIGHTLIDLEDRWFSSMFHCLTEKPIERRPLMHPSSSRPQGEVEVIIELIRLDAAKRIPLIDIKPPPVEQWEIRLIIWECRNVMSKDSITGMNDLYVCCSLTGRGVESKGNVQKTDVHYRSKDGFGSFNYRMTWTVPVPVQQPPRLKMQLFDKDFGGDDSICECIFSMTPLYKAGYLKKDMVTLYEDQNDKIWLDELKHPNIPENAGEILISLQMVPDQIVKEFPAGKGRDAPNQNPILFPPTGRVRFSMNPAKVLGQVLGPTIMRKFKMFLCLGCALLLFIAFAPAFGMVAFQKIVDEIFNF